MNKPSGFFGNAPVREERRIVLPSGRKITVLETTGADESVLSKAIKNNLAQGVNKFLSRVSKDLDEKEGSVAESEFRSMLTGDRIAALIHTRMLTHGSLFPYALKCTNCTHVTDFEIDLQAIVAEIKSYPHGDAREFFVDIDGHKLFFKLPDGATEEKIEQNQDLDINKKLNAMYLWEETENGRLPVLVDNLRSSHIAKLRKKIKEVDCDMETIAHLNCSKCGTRHVANVVGDISFLFPNMT